VIASNDYHTAGGTSRSVGLCLLFEYSRGRNQCPEISMFNRSPHGPVSHILWVPADIMAFIFSRGAKIAVILKCLMPNCTGSPDWRAPPVQLGIKPNKAR